MMVLESPPKIEHFRKMIAYEHKVYGGEYMPFNRSLEILRKNPYMYIVLMDGNEVAGLVSVYTPNLKGADIILSRKEVEKRARAKYYLGPKEMHKTKLLYFAGITAVGSGEKRKNRAAALMYGRASLIEKRIRLPKFAYAIGATAAGVKLIKSYGGVQIGYASAEKAEDPFFRIRITKNWCRKVKARALKRVMPEMRLAQIK